MEWRKRNLFICLLFTSMLLITFFYFKFVELELKEMYLFNGLYSRWAVEVVDDSFLLEDGLSQLPHGSRVFIEHDERGHLRSFKQSGSWEPPLVSGEFFDGDSQLPKAVVGQRSKTNLNQEALLAINDVEFEMIGVMGVADRVSFVDPIILINDQGLSLPVYRVIIDHNSPAQMRRIEVMFEVEPLDLHPATASQVFNGIDITHNSHFARMVGINVFSITLILTVMVSALSFSLFKTLDEVSFILGFSKKEIYLRNILRLLLLYIPGLFLISVLDLFNQSRFILDYGSYYFLFLLLTIFSYSMIFINKGLKQKGGFHRDP